MVEDFDIDIVNYLDREDKVAEVYYKAEQWVEISIKNNCPVIQFHPSLKKKYWEVPLEEALKALKKAKSKFLLSMCKEGFLRSIDSLSPENVNAQAEQILKEILEHPERKIIKQQLERFGEVVDIYEPKGKGARYTADGEFLGFLEYKGY